MRDHQDANRVKPLWKVDDVARRLGKSKDWIYHHIGGGFEPQLPYIKIGGAIRFREADIEAYIERCSNGVAKAA